MLRNNQKFLSTFGHGLTPSDVQGQQVASGGLFSMIRASGEMDVLEKKIASRTAAGKSTASLEKKLGKAQQSITRIGSITKEGFNFLNTAETTLFDLQKAQVSGRGTPGMGVTGGGRSLNPDGSPKSVRGARGRFEAAYDPTGRGPYFSTATTDALPGSSKVNVMRGPGGAYSAQVTLPSGQTQQRFISSQVGSQFFQGGVGYSGNLLASTAGGVVTQSMMGYMRGSQGYIRAGGLSGNALRAANVAVDDAVKVIGRMTDAGVGFKRGSGVQSVDDLASAVRSGAKDLYGTVDDVLAAQTRVAEAGGRAGRGLSASSFGLSGRAKADQRAKRLDPRLGTSRGSDMVVIRGRGAAGMAPNAALADNLIVQNTAMAEGRASKVMLTTDVSDDIVRSLGAREVGKDFLEKGFLKSYGVRGTIQAFSQGGSEARKLMLNRGMGGAMRFANPILTASAVYDISKMAATAIIGGGARLARDAVKSMQGSINKPSFGMGFVDNEVAATSRARGVMAIQNSRLNARSALGSEGAMMAARFG